MPDLIIRLMKFQDDVYMSRTDICRWLTRVAENDAKTLESAKLLRLVRDSLEEVK